MEFVSSPGKIDSVYSGAALCEPDSRLNAYVSIRELEPVEILQRLIDKGCTIQMAHQLAMAYYQRGVAGGGGVPQSNEEISDVTSTSRSIRSERFFLQCDNWLHRPGYCYTAMVRPSRRSAVAQMVGEFPALDRMLRIPVGDMAWRKLSDIWFVQVAPITMHMQLHQSEGAYRFLNQIAALVKKFPSFFSQEWRDIVSDVPPDDDCYIGMATRFGVKTKGGDTLIDFSDYAKVVPTSDVYRPIVVQVDNLVNGSEDLDRVVHAGRESELKVRDDEMVTYRFEEPRILWITPKITVDIDNGMSYHSVSQNIWLRVSGDLRCKISGAKGMLRLGRDEDHGVAIRFAQLRDVSARVFDAAVVSIGSRPDVTVVSSQDMSRLGIRGTVTTLEFVALLTVGDVSNYAWETEEVARALSSSMKLSCVDIQVTLVAWEEFPSVMQVVHKLGDVANQLSMLQSVYHDISGRVQEAVVTSRIHYRDYTGTVVVSHEGHVIAACHEYPRAVVLPWRQAQGIVLDSMLLRLYRSDRYKFSTRTMRAAFPLCKYVLTVAPYKVELK